MTAPVCLYFGSPGECQCCGGSTTSEGGVFVEGVWVPDGTRGPFEGDSRFCSEECWEDMQEFRPAGLLPCCPDCGFDRGEHDEGCERERGRSETNAAERR